MVVREPRYVAAERWANLTLKVIVATASLAFMWQTANPLIRAAIDPKAPADTRKLAVDLVTPIIGAAVGYSFGRKRRE